MLTNWMPYKLLWEDGVPSILWMDMEDRYIEEPFFDETIVRNRIGAKHKGRWLLSSSDMHSLCAWASQLDAYPPMAFIFHVSRCGSTLLSQCLVTDKRYISIPEAPLLDELLQINTNKLPNGMTKEQLFKAVLSFLGQRRLDQEQLFVKLDSWHLHHYELLRSWFPDTPFYLLSREPKAIIRSHEKRRGIQMIPGYLPQGAVPLQAVQAHFQDFSLYTADVLCGFYRALAAIREMGNPLDRFYDYAWGMTGMLQDFEVHTGAVLQSEATLERLKKHSKYPGQIFEEAQVDEQGDKYEHAIKSYLQYYQSICRNEKV